MTFPTHKLRGRAKPAGEVVTEFLNFEEVNKSARVKQLMKELPIDLRIFFHSWAKISHCVNFLCRDATQI